MQSTFLRSLVFPLLIVLLLISLGPTPVTQAATVNLDVDRSDDPAVTTAGTGAAACTTAANDCSLRGAILTANAAVSDVYVINLPTGTYTLTLSGASEDGNKTGDLDIVRDMTIAGAGASTTVINGDNIDRVLDVITGTVAISGVTIRGGKAPDGTPGIDAFPIGTAGGPGANGGGIRNTAALTLTNCIITANKAGTGGAGATNALAFMPTSGGSGGMGGGIYNTGALTIINTSISNNSTGNGGVGGSGMGTMFPSGGAPGGNGGDGGGIYNGGNLNLARVAMAANMTGNGGLGGAGSPGGPPPVPGMPAGVGGPGGNGGKGGNGSAIHNSGQVTVTNSTLSGNTAGNGGAGANGGTGGAGSAAPPSAGGNGGNGGTGGNGGDGGIYNYNGLFATVAITMTSATITANTAGNSGSPGSGGSGGPGGPSMPNGNNGSPGPNGAIGTGGGVAVYGGVSSLKNTILANNTTPTGGQGPDCYGTITSQGYNLIRTLTNCTVGGNSTGNITGQDPKLSALADNGGGTLTHALQFSSPAVNAADPAGCKDAAGNPLLVDQRGLPRTYGGRCDIGAFELQLSGLFLPLLRR